MIMAMLNVADLRRSTQFYTDILGFDIALNMPDENGKDMFNIVVRGQASIGLTEIRDDMKVGGPGVELMIYVPDDVDIDAYYQDVVRMGIIPVKEIVTEFWGDRYFTIHDPDGYVLSFAKTVQQMTSDEIMANMTGGGSI